MYTAWAVRMIPLLFVVAVADCLVLLLIKPRNVNLKGTRAYFRGLYQKMDRISRDEKIALLMFAFVLILCFTRNLYAEILPGLKPAFVFLICGLLTFIIPKQDGGFLNRWQDAFPKLSWDLIYMCGGGMAAGALLDATGAIDQIAALIRILPLNGQFGTYLVFCALTIGLSEISNNTSAAAISMPIVFSICEGLSLNPMPYLYTVIASFNCAYMLPTTIRTIPVGLGLKPRYLLKNGTLMTLVNIFVLSAAGYLLSKFWPLFRCY